MAKYALVIGCNYAKTERALKYSIPNARSFADFLKSKGYLVKLLTDDKPGVSAYTVQRALTDIANLRNLRSLVVYFSGHGGQVSSQKQGIESYDQMIVLGDGTALTDDILQATFKKFPSECKIRVFIDASHSGTMLDLPFMNGARMNIQRVTEWCAGLKANPDITSIAACADDQTRNENPVNELPVKGQFMSASFTSALLQILKQKVATPAEIEKAINYNFMAQRLAQRVTLTSSDPINLHSPLDL